MTSLLRSVLAALAVGLALLAVPAMAATMKFTADLEAASETPPATSSGTGAAKVSFDTVTKKLSWTVT